MSIGCFFFAFSKVFKDLSIEIAETALVLKRHRQRRLPV